MKSIIRRAKLLVGLLSLVLFIPAVFAADPSRPITAEDYTSPIRVACVGDSITFGSGTSFPEFESYPAQLKRMMGEKWNVRNFGVSGCTLLNAGDNPYQKNAACTNALKFKPDVVVILLGANDSKPQNWKFKDQFVSDYKELIGKFKALSSQPRIFICLPTLVPGSGNYGINELVVQEEIKLIDGIAADENVGVIDMQSVLAGREELLPDRVHPNDAGATLMARKVYATLTGKEFTGEVPSKLTSQWHNFQRVDFVVDGRMCLLVIPKTPAKGNPWIWRTEFFDVEPQTELALLAKGYYVAYMNLQDMYGAPVGLDHMDKFYEYLQTEYKLSPKTVLEGFSRGGLFAYNWAARRPENVASMYVDAPVCDFKSWPGGKGKGVGSPADWERCKKVYGLTEEQAMAYPINPLDNLKPLANAKIPIISVCGDADKTVPFDENTLIVEKRYKDLGGEIKVVIKHGGDHHPHSLPDPTPMVDFILEHNPDAAVKE